MRFMAYTHHADPVHQELRAVAAGCPERHLAVFSSHDRLQEALEQHGLTAPVTLFYSLTDGEEIRFLQSIHDRFLELRLMLIISAGGDPVLLDQAHALRPRLVLDAAWDLGHLPQIMEKIASGNGRNAPIPPIRTTHLENEEGGESHEKTLPGI